LLRKLLEGIKTLHEMGIMHCDIRLKNMLVMSTEPPRASLCDYGKAIKAENSTVTTIGPICTLAPEIWSVSMDGLYHHKIDLWVYDYAIAEILGYNVQQYPCPDGFHTNNPQITRNRHGAILQMLHAHCVKVSEDESLIDLASKLLVWKPEERWSAAQALEHACWDPIRQEQKEDRRDEENAADMSRPRTKRSQLNDPRSKPDG
jgi:serine/threonine protein kinase